MERNITLEILENLGTLAENARGYTTEVNVLRWNNGDPKVDIRQWSPGNHHALKGISLTEMECMKLYMILKKYYGEEKEANDVIDSFEEV